MHFDLVDLNLFRHVVEAGSITRGAERSHLALAAASTRVRDLEREAGAPLLVRGRQGVVPTPAGRTLLAHARAMLGQAERLRGDLAAFAGGEAGQVKLLSNTNALDAFLPDALGSFLALHPQVGVDVEERLSDEIVGLDRLSALSRFLADKASRIGKPLRLRVQLRSFDAVCRLVERRIGLGIVPETTARRAARTMALAVVALSDPWAVRELAICVRDLEALSPLARELVEHLRRG